VIKNAEIEKILVASTAHLTRDDNELLSAMEESPSLVRRVNVIGRSYGHLIRLPNINWSGDKPDLAAMKDVERGLEQIRAEDGLSVSFINTCHAAAKMGCEFVLFDADGPVYEELPNHDW